MPLVVPVALKLAIEADPAPAGAKNNEKFVTSKRRATVVFRFRQDWQKPPARLEGDGGGAGCGRPSHDGARNEVAALEKAAESLWESVKAGSFSDCVVLRFNGVFYAQYSAALQPFLLGPGGCWRSDQQVRLPSSRRLLRVGGLETCGSSHRQSFMDWSCRRSEEHTSELQSRFGISYAGFC